MPSSVLHRYQGCGLGRFKKPTQGGWNAETRRTDASMEKAGVTLKQNGAPPMFRPRWDRSLPERSPPLETAGELQECLWARWPVGCLRCPCI